MVIFTNRRYRGYGDDAAGGVTIDPATVSSWPVASVCGPGTVPILIGNQVVCGTPEATSAFTPLLSADINGMQVAQLPNGPVLGGEKYACGPGTGRTVYGGKVSMCTPGGGAVGLTAKGAFVLASDYGPGAVWIPTPPAPPAPPPDVMAPAMMAPPMMAPSAPMMAPVPAPMVSMPAPAGMSAPSSGIGLKLALGAAALYLLTR